MTSLKFKTVADWIITASCPLRCEHCIIGALVANAEAEKSQELNTAECKKLIDFLHDHGTRALSITGGEALTRKDLLEIIDYGRAKGLKTFLYTTGLPFMNLSTGELKTDYTQKVLSRIDFLGISLDMFHDEAYQQIKTGDYCEKLVRALFGYASLAFKDLQIQIFTVLGRRKGVATIKEVVAECSHLANIINTVALEISAPIRWRLSPFRFSPGSMLPWQRRLLFSQEEMQSIKQELELHFEGNPNFTTHFGVDYDSFFVYPDGKFRTVQLDENGIDRIVELGTFRGRVLKHPEIWRKLYESDGETARRMKRDDILKLGDGI